MALTDAQRKERLTGIGGSDAAAICGLSKWKTPYQVYLEKIGETNSDDLSGKEYIHFGSILEPIIADEYARRSGNEVELVTDLFRHPEYHWMIGNVDRTLKDKNGALECKTANAYTLSAWGESESDDFPDEYLIQCAHYACVKQYDFVALAVLIGGSTFRTYNYKRNARLEERLIKIEQNFWLNHVLKRIPPPPINSEDAAMMWADVKGNFVTADDITKEYLQKLKTIHKEIKTFEKEKANLEFALKTIIQDHEGISDEYGNLLLTWKSQETNRFDVTKFKLEQPNLYKEFTKASNSRVFRLRGTKDE